MREIACGKTLNIFLLPRKTHVLWCCAEPEVRRRVVFHLLATEWENCNVVEHHHHHRRNVAQLTTQLHETEARLIGFSRLNWLCVCV